MATRASDLSADALNIVADQAVSAIAAAVDAIVLRDLRKKGVVVGLSGGIDSSVVAALCARALGSQRVLGLLMPERESAEETLELGGLVAETFGIETIVEDITPLLEAAGCYTRRDAAIRRLIPAYGPGWKSKVTLPSVID